MTVNRALAIFAAATMMSVVPSTAAHAQFGDDALGDSGYQAEDPTSPNSQTGPSTITVLAIPTVPAAQAQTADADHGPSAHGSTIILVKIKKPGK